MFLEAIVGRVKRLLDYISGHGSAAAVAVVPPVEVVIAPPLMEAFAPTPMPQVAGFVMREAAPVDRLLAARLSVVATLNVPAGRKPFAKPARLPVAARRRQAAQVSRPLVSEASAPVRGIVIPLPPQTAERRARAAAASTAKREVRNALAA